jgi:N-acetylglucosaminyldiphosphoundecaprenol N-acetyl-beta-D-mannosaminyltransferase
MGVGGSFEILVGDVRRAPSWIQRCGLEWAMRFMQEPGRLGPRYARDFFGLAKTLPATLLAGWMQRPFLGSSHINTVTTPQAMHVYVHGKLGAEVGPALLEASAASVAANLVMVVHLQGAKHVTAAGLGSMMSARRNLLDHGLTLSLAGLQFKHKFLLHAWCAHPLFDEWPSTIAYARSMAKDMETSARLDLHRKADALASQTRARG